MPSSSFTQPSRQGVHWPHDSSTKNSMKFLATRSMSRPGPKTITLPPVDTSSKAILRSNRAAGTQYPLAPPTWTALAPRPPTASSTSAIVIPMGNSYTPGRSQSPETLSSFTPGDFSVPMPLNHAAPLARIAADKAKVLRALGLDKLGAKRKRGHYDFSVGRWRLIVLNGTEIEIYDNDFVSTLLTIDGFPVYPTSTGIGGRLRASPRWPSSDSIRAVSSPHTYAPAPM